MTTKFRLILLMVLLVMSTATAHAESAGQAGAFLKMGVGARALGMGSAFTAVADDSTAAFWNPAGLALLEKSEGSFMHANLTLDRKYNFFNYAHVLKDKDGKSRGTVALSHVRFGIDGIPETRLATKGGPLNNGDVDGNGSFDDPATQADGTGIKGQNVYIFSYFDDTETSTFGSYARRFGDKWYGGINLKSIKQDLFTNSADTWGMDLGFLYKPAPRATFGLSLRDLGESLKWDTPSGRSDRVPVTTTFGAAYKPRDNMTVALDVNKVEDLNAKFRVGTEYWFKDLAALRMGSEGGEFTMGASFKLSSWRFDYSYVDETLGVAHRVSALKQF
jgi:hypothetical protein